MRQRNAASPVSLAAKSQQAALSGAESQELLGGVGSEPPVWLTPPPNTTATTRALACRVDALVVAFKVALSSAIDCELNECQALANATGAAEMRAGATRFALKRNRSRDHFLLENSDMRVVVDRCARGGWTVEVTVHAVFLATHPLGDAIALTVRLAATLGAVSEARLRRFDLAADFAGFSLSPSDVERLQTTRSKAQQFVVQDKDVAEVGTPLGRSLREYRDSALKVTGFAVSSGNPVMARIYDKQAEVRLPGREEKRAIEEARWLSAGWDRSQGVVRVEFQHRGLRARRSATCVPAHDAGGARSVCNERSILPNLSSHPPQSPATAACG